MRNLLSALLDHLARERLKGELDDWERLRLTERAAREAAEVRLLAIEQARAEHYERSRMWGWWN